MSIHFNNQYEKVNNNDLNFQQFNYNQQPQQEYYPPQQQTYQPPVEVGWESIKRAFSTGGYDNEPPLLEGL